MLRSKQARLELLVLTAITMAALAARVWSLGDLPVGILGDEALSGLEAQRILRQGSIGVYSEVAAGLPAGTLYLMAASVALLGSNIVALRLVAALLGTATIPLFYLLVRRYSGCRAPFALAGTAVLAASGWHIYYNRIAIPPVGLALVAAAAAIALMEALERGQRRWWLLAGALHGTGFYIYDGYAPYLAIVCLFVAALLVARKVKKDAALAFALAAVVAAAPFLAYAANPANQYFLHLRRDAVWQQAQWQSATRTEKVTTLARRYVEWWKAAGSGLDDPDTVDGMAIPIAPPLMLALAAIGLWTLRRQRRPLLYLALLVVLLLPISSALTGTRMISAQGEVFSASSGYARRTFPMVIFLVLFVACGLQVVAGALRRRWAAGMVTLVLVALVCLQNGRAYFKEFADPANQRWVFSREISDASRFMAQLSPDHYIYYYSSRWSFEYEIRVFLAPNVRGEGHVANESDLATMTIESDLGKGRPVFMLLDTGRALFDRIVARYPGNDVVYGAGDSEPAFIAILPR